MHAAKGVVKKVQRNLMTVILNFLAVAICEPRKSAHPHPHRKVLLFDITGADVFRIGLPLNTPVRQPMQVAGL